MKKHSYISLLLFLVINISANELGWVNKQIEAIKPEREGINNTVITQLYDPFLIYKKAPEKKDVTKKSTYSASKTYTKEVATRPTSDFSSLRLSVIMNKSVLINGKWYKKNHKVGRYKISKINSSSVLLTRNNKKYTLYMSDKTNNLKFKNEIGSNNETN